MGRLPFVRQLPEAYNSQADPPEEQTRALDQNFFYDRGRSSRGRFESVSTFYGNPRRGDVRVVAVFETQWGLENDQSRPYPESLPGDPHKPYSGPFKDYPVTQGKFYDLYREGGGSSPGWHVFFQLFKDDFIHPDRNLMPFQLEWVPSTNYDDPQVGGGIYIPFAYADPSHPFEQFHVSNDTVVRSGQSDLTEIPGFTDVPSAPALAVWITATHYLGNGVVNTTQPIPLGTNRHHAAWLDPAGWGPPDEPPNNIYVTEGVRIASWWRPIIESGDIPGITRECIVPASNPPSVVSASTFRFIVRGVQDHGTNVMAI